MSGQPAILCPRCGERVLLREGQGSAGAKIFICRACGQEFSGQDFEGSDAPGD
jgi:DNA-directed RNA polymerase subunit RPC12/RpoP